MSQPTLSEAALSTLRPELQPLVRHGELSPRIVHFGLGAFHRAHQCVYTECAGGGWGIAAVANTNAALVRALRRQDCYFSVLERRPDAAVAAVNGALAEALLSGDDHARVQELLADPQVSLVTLTITEKGYSPDAAPFQHIASSLAARYRGHRKPLTIISCDNMAANGARTRETALRAVAGLDAGPGLASWVERACAFPDTLVDRIVPATTEADKALCQAALGVADDAPAVAEPFRQWVIQDCFATERPAWEVAGAEFTSDVAPHQLAKLRLLNGSHSALAYLGLAAGLQTIDAAMNTDWGPGIVRGICAEAGPALPAGGPDPAQYAKTLVRRFQNPAMFHQLRQIAADGSQKVPYRWLDTMRARPGATPTHEAALAAWVWACRPETAAAYGIADPLAEELAACWADATVAQALARLLGLLGYADLATPSLQDRITELVDGLEQQHGRPLPITR